MELTKKEKKRLKRLAILCAVCLVLCGACVLAALGTEHSLDSQRAAERWAGEGETAFSQLSCYLPENKKITLNEVYRFRLDAMDKLHEAALDIENELSLIDDCWSSVGLINITSDRGTTEASVIAVGGDFFGFHPLELLSGSYLRESDIMKDRVILDRELAWRLFGGYDLEGLTVYINDSPFTVAGVIEREDDYADKKAYTAGMGLYMSFDAYTAITGEGISCYEVILPEPVKDFAQGIVKEKFPISTGEIIQNTNRFSYGRLMKLGFSFASRSMQTLGVIYPYWENAARCIEDWCIRFVMLATVLAIIPVISMIGGLIALLSLGKDALEEKLFPKLKDHVGEFFRRIGRKRWEKKQRKRSEK